MNVGPELVGDTWLGTGGRRLRLADLRGRIVLLDFWTLCCVNCHHVLAELRQIEQRFADVLTVVGVHSPKFEHEKDPAAVTAAMQRHGITHPVLNDPEMNTWQAYDVRAWPKPRSRCDAVRMFSYRCRPHHRSICSRERRCCLTKSRF